MSVVGRKPATIIMIMMIMMIMIMIKMIMMIIMIMMIMIMIIKIWRNKLSGCERCWSRGRLPGGQQWVGALRRGKICAIILELFYWHHHHIIFIDITAT